MPNEKEFVSRLQQKHDTEENWEIAGTNGFIPKKAEIIIYDIDNTHTSPRMKIGDGEKVVNELPFYTSQENDSPLNIELDVTLTDPNKAAQAKAVGDALNKKISNGGEVFLESDLIFTSNYSVQIPSLLIKSEQKEITNNIHFYHRVGTNERPVLEILGADNDELVRISGLAEPQEQTDATTKNYVDGRIGKIDIALDNIIAIQNALIGGTS